MPLCARYHHLIHDLDWTLHLDHHRTLTIRNTDGDIHAVAPLPTTVEHRTDRAEETPIPDFPDTRRDRDDRPPGRPPDPAAEQLTLIA